MFSVDLNAFFLYMVTPVSCRSAKNGSRANTYVQEQGDNERHCSADVCRNKSLSQTVHQYYENIGLEILRNDINRAARSAYGGVAWISD